MARVFWRIGAARVVGDHEDGGAYVVEEYPPASGCFRASSRRDDLTLASVVELAAAIAVCERHADAAERGLPFEGPTVGPDT